MLGGRSRILPGHFERRQAPARGKRGRIELRRERHGALLDRSRLRRLLDHRDTMQVWLDRRGVLAEARAVDLQVLHHPLDVVARLGEWNALDPVDGIDLGIARIAMLRHPLLDPAAARVVAREGEDKGAAIVLEQGGDFSSAQLRIVDLVRDETVPVIGDAEPLGGVAPGRRRHLHQPDRLGERPVALIESAFRPHDRIDDAAIERGTDRLVVRHADVGKGVVIQRQPAPQCGLADEQHRLGIVVASRELAEPRNHGFITALSGKIGQER